MSNNANTSRDNFEKITLDLIRKHATLIERYGYGYLWEESNFVCNECLVKLDEDKGRFGSYFYKALDNYFTKMAVKSSKMDSLDSVRDFECEDSSAREQVDEIMAHASLNEIQRKVITLKFLFSKDMLTDEEVGEMLGVTHQYVNKVLRQAIAIMKNSCAVA